MAALVGWDESGRPQMQDGTHYESQARPQEVKKNVEKWIGYYYLW